MRSVARLDAVARQPEMNRLTDDAGLTMQPTLSADGELLVRSSTSLPAIESVAVAGGRIERLCNRCAVAIPR